jgi:hypothetical protein
MARRRYPGRPNVVRITIFVVRPPEIEKAKKMIIETGCTESGLIR